MFTIARKIIQDHANEPAYEYFLKGLYLKIIGSLALCLIYLFYYQGGDTINYMSDTRALMRLASKDLGSFLILFLMVLIKKGTLFLMVTLGFRNTFIIKLKNGE